MHPSTHVDQHDATDDDVLQLSWILYALLGDFQLFVMSDVMMDGGGRSNHSPLHHLCYIFPCHICWCKQSPDIDIPTMPRPLRLKSKQYRFTDNDTMKGSVLLLSMRCGCIFASVLWWHTKSCAADYGAIQWGNWQFHDLTELEYHQNAIRKLRSRTTTRDKNIVWFQWHCQNCLPQSWICSC